MTIDQLFSLIFFALDCAKVLVGFIGLAIMIIADDEIRKELFPFNLVVNIVVGNDNHITNNMG
jgi:hypothetical protein